MVPKVIVMLIIIIYTVLHPAMERIYMYKMKKYYIIFSLLKWALIRILTELHPETFRACAVCESQ